MLLFLLSATAVAQQVLESTVSVLQPLSTKVLRDDVYGYSIEPISVNDYISNNYTTTVFQSIADVIGKPPPVRIGGTTSDDMAYVPNLNQPAVLLPDPNNTTFTRATKFYVSQPWFQRWGSYFPAGTDYIMCINFGNETNSWESGVAEAVTAYQTIGSALKRIEFGNEVDHYIEFDWRAPGWNTTQYAAQFHQLERIIYSTPAFSLPRRNAGKLPTLQAAVISDPPDISDQQDEVDDFDIINITKAGVVNTPSNHRISYYAQHLYPQSNCDAPRKARLRLDLLSDHLVLWKNVSQFIKEQQAAQNVGHAPLIFGETNSVSCSGKSGISDTFAAALWSTDYVLMAASLDIQQVFFHLGAQSDYSAVVPKPYTEFGERIEAPGIRANLYSHVFMAHVLAEHTEAESWWKRFWHGGMRARWAIAALPDANSSDFSGYAIYDSRASVLKKLVFLDMGVWNGTEGLSNPATMSATDSTFVSAGTRPVRQLTVSTPWREGSQAKVIRLQGPGSNAKSLVNVSGSHFDVATGKLAGKMGDEFVTVGPGGVLKSAMPKAHAAVFELV